MTVEPVTPVRPSPELCAKAPPKPGERDGSAMNAEAALWVSDLESWGETGWRILAAERERRCGENAPGSERN